MAKKYLDDNGMSYFWGKLKDYFQAKLVSGTNIKTINNETLLGSGDITLPSPADYVVEQGTSGIWTYRKWNSGIAECWGTYTASIAVNTSSASYGGYRSAAVDIPTYPLTFVSAPSVTATSGNATGHWVNNVVPTTTGGTYYLSIGASATASNRSVAFHVFGRWK